MTCNGEDRRSERRSPGNGADGISTLGAVRSCGLGTLLVRGRYERFWQHIKRQPPLLSLGSHREFSFGREPQLQHAKEVVSFLLRQVWYLDRPRPEETLAR